MKSMQVEKINFELLKTEDLLQLYQWFQLPHVKKWYARGETFSLEKIKDIYLSRIDNPKTIPNFIAYLNQHPIGYIQFYHVNVSLPDSILDYNHPLFKKYDPTKIAGIDLFIGEEKLLGQGYGEKILREFIDQYIKNKFEVVVVDPAIKNLRAINFFKKFGFVEFNAFTEQNEYILLVLEI